MTPLRSIEPERTNGAVHRSIVHVGLLFKPTVSSSRDFCEVVRLLKMKPSLYQDNFKTVPVILWIDIPYKVDFWCFRIFCLAQHRNFDITP